MLRGISHLKKLAGPYLENSFCRQLDALSEHSQGAATINDLRNGGDREINQGQRPDPNRGFQK
jgi:hypothetical protein